MLILGDSFFICQKKCNNYNCSNGNCDSEKCKIYTDAECGNIMEKWFIQAKKADFDLWSRELGIDRLTARLLRNRDILTLEEARMFMYGNLGDMHSPWLLKDMDVAVIQILGAIGEGKKIRIIGDYDVDGVTSSYILLKGFESLGAEVSVAIPHRIHDGYGLSDGLVEDAAKDGVELIVTCDNGISAAPQVELASSLGIDVIVTDHHEVPFEITEGTDEKNQLLPKALAVVNPKRFDDSYPFKGICGAMVAYKLILALQEKTGSGRLAGILDECLQFAALGTVCDVMELKDENRIAVREGLKKMVNTENKGLAALMEVNKLAPEKITAYSLGFVIGPCINASGRLDTAARALELLNAENKAQALTIATELKGLNDSRKNLTNDGIEEAERYIAKNSLLKKAVWVIFLPDVHESIAGIIAGKIRERYNHPVFVLTRGEEMLKGSGRSIEAYHMQQHLVQAGSLLEKYGGHAMAAGLSIKEEKLAEFDRVLNEQADLKDEDYVAKVSIDAAMPFGYANLALARELDRLEPYGTGNPRPLFAQKDVEFIGMQPFGREGQYARYRVRTAEGSTLELTSFDNPEKFCSFLDGKYGTHSGERFRNGLDTYKVTVTYQIGINDFRGENLQYLLKNYI